MVKLVIFFNLLIFMRLSLAQFTPSVIQRKIKGYALYGPNEALAHGLLKEITETTACRVIAEEDLISSANQIFMPSLFAPVVNTIIVPRVTAAKLSWHTDFVTSLPEKFVMIMVMALPYQPFLKSSTIATVGCYDATYEESKIILRRYMQKENLILTSSAADFCAELTQQGNWAEVCQILSLCKDSPITCEKLHELFPLPERDLALVFLEKKQINLQNVEEPIKIIRMWQKLFTQLWQLKILSEKYPREEALGLVTPPLFFKHSAALFKSIPLWTYAQLSKAMEDLLACELDIKQDSSKTAMIFTRLLQSVHKSY